MAEGWIKLYRTIQDHWIWNDPQKLKWWLDILLLANHKENKFILGNDLMQLERGEFHTSLVKLSERWGVDRKTIRRFLDVLECDKMITQKRTTKGTTIKVSNYADYQDFSEVPKDNKRDRKVPAKGTTKSQQSPSERDTNNNDKNVKNDNNEKNIYSDNPELNKCILEFIKMRKSIKAPMTDKAINLMLNKLDKLAASDNKKIEILNQSIMNSWKGIFPIKNDNNEKAFQNDYKQKEYDIKDIEKKLLGWDEEE